MKIFIFILLITSSFDIFSKTIKVGISPVVSSAGIYLAQARGYFKDEGLEIELTDFNNSSAAMTSLLSKGELDVGAGNISSSLFNAINAGQKFKIVADKGHLEKGKEYIALIVRRDHILSGRYKEVRDLKGFKFGFTSVDGVSQQIVLDKILTSAGIKTNEVEFIKLSYAEMNNALKIKMIDATIQIEPYLTKACLDGDAQNVLSAQLIYPNQQSAAIFYSQSFIVRNKMEAKKFMKAYLRGVIDYNFAFIKNIKRAEAITDLKKFIKIENEKIWTEMNTVGLNLDGMINEQLIQNDLNWYYEKKYIDKIPSMDKILDLSFVNSAFAEIKKMK